MATPNDHIDMMNNTPATALATIVIDPNSTTRSTGHPPSKRTRLTNERSLQREIHRHGHHDRHRHAVEQRWRVLPLFHGLDRRLIEQGYRPEHLDVLHAAVGADGRLEDDDALHAG